MLSVTDTTFDFLILQLILHRASLALLLLRILLPVRAGSEYDVFPSARGIKGWPSWILLRETELRPCLALGDSGVHHFPVYGEADATRSLDLLAIIVESPADDCLGSVLVCGGRRRG